MKYVISAKLISGAYPLFLLSLFYNVLLGYKKCLRFCLIVFLLLFSGGVQGQYFKQLTMKDGLSNLSVLTIYQDVMGRMWFGTNEGINVYDGEHITRYKYYEIVDGPVRKRKVINGMVDQIVGDTCGNVFMRNSGLLLSYNIQKESFNELCPSKVSALFMNEGVLWFAKADSLFQYKENTVSFVRKADTPTITCMEKKNGRLWLGTKRGLYVVEKDKATLVLPEVEIYNLFVSSRDELWVASRMNGLYRVDRNDVLKKEPCTPSRVVSEQIRCFVEDEKHTIWFGTFDGLQVYNPYSDTYRVYLPNHTPGSLSHKSIFSLCKDKQGNIWIGSYYGGVNFFNSRKEIFRYYVYNQLDKHCLDCPIVGEMVEDKDHNLWICTDGGGVNCLNRNTGVFTYYRAGDGNNYILHDNVKTIAYDKDADQLYIGTYTGGLSLYDRRSGRFHNYLKEVHDSDTAPNEIIYHCLFHDGYLYVTARNGFWRMKAGSHHFELISNKDLFQAFEIDSRGYVWLASDLDLYCLPLNDRGNLEQIHLVGKEESKVRISRIKEASDGTVYLATAGNGVFAYKYADSGWTHYTAANHSLLSDFCYNLAESSMGNILVTCDKGISIYSPFNGSVRSIELGPPKDIISAVADGGGIYVSEDDLIYIGGVDGMIAFREKELYVRSEDSGDFYFSSLLINNVKVTPDDESRVLEKAIAFVDRVELSSYQNNMTVKFASSNYVGQERSTWYKYKLEGFDKEWVLTNRLEAAYTNLLPGNYILKVRAVGNGLTDLSGKEIKLGITIHHPWYATVWAYLIYMLFISGMIYVFWRIRYARHLLALSLEQEKEEKLRIEEVNKVKLRFFTNISHEFRTPLTLIIGQVEMLVQSENLSGSIYKRLQSVHKNALYLRSLITELLDFRKQEQGFMTLKVECMDIIPFANEIYQSFAAIARKRGMNYTFEHVDERFDVWFDPAQIQKVIFNLLSNAFKYTPDGKSVKLSIRKLQSRVEISVSDAGCGISQDAQQKIFERFYQADESSPEGFLGSGIGLALAKGIVEAHRGTITVESLLGEGSCFRVQLMLGNAHFTQEELKHRKSFEPRPQWQELLQIEAEVLQEEVSDADSADKVMPDKDEERPVILLVEDDKEMLDMLEDIFLPAYTVYKATDGQMGLEKVQQLRPDIVVSDVMMPVMSGKEMCYKIKNSLELAYIPVVLLTAQSSVDYTIEGYMFGADDYITKPFNVKLLLARCNNLLNSRKMLMKHSGMPVRSASPSVRGMSSADSQLLDTIVQIIKRNFDNPDFDMNMLASELGMGRSKMFIRFKEMTGLTPNEFTLKLKLEEALRMLKEEPQYNISEISYHLGFSSSRYFSRCFKSFFGVAPQNYRKNSGS